MDNGAAAAARTAPRGTPGPMFTHAHWYFALAFLVVAAGFFPSFLARLGQTDVAHLVHGVSAFGWMGLLVVQSWLIHHGDRPTHRRIGRWSWLIVLPLLVGAALMLRSMLASDNGFARTFGPRLAFIDITTIGFFVCAYLLAIHHRRRVQLHARWMATTAVLVMPPAVARLMLNVGLIGSFTHALHLSLLMTEFVALALIAVDRRGGRVFPPFVALFSFLVLQHVGLQWIPTTAAWQAVCRWIAGG